MRSRRRDTFMLAVLVVAAILCAIATYVNARAAGLPDCSDFGKDGVRFEGVPNETFWFGTVWPSRGGVAFSPSGAITVTHVLIQAGSATAIHEPSLHIVGIPYWPPHENGQQLPIRYVDFCWDFVESTPTPVSTPIASGNTEEPPPTEEWPPLRPTYTIYLPAIGG